MKGTAYPYTIAALLILIVCISFFAYENGYRLAITNDSAPAWIQAVGSILAIIAAALIARHQNLSTKRLEDQKQALSDKQKFEVIMALMARANGLAKDICKAYLSNKPEDVQNISPPLMHDTHIALLALPPFEIPNWQLALDVLMIGRAISGLHDQFMAITQEPPATDDVYKAVLSDLNELATEIRQVSKESVAICKKEIKKRETLLDTYG